MSWKFEFFFATILIALLLGACQTEEKRYIPDVSDISVDIEIRRFEQDLFSLDTSKMEEGLAGIQEKYPVFSDLFFNRILAASDPQVAPEGSEAYIRGFIQHPPIQTLYDTCMIVYSEMDDLEAAFEKAFKFYKYYFPGRETPDVTTFISEYTIGNFIYGEQSLAVGLDFFLGADYPYQQYNPGEPVFSNYMIRSFNKDHLVAKTLMPLIQDLTGDGRGSRLLDLAIHNGKQLYILDHLLPNTPDSVKMEVNQEQMEWLEQNEFEIWTFLLKEDLLYSSEWQEIRKYVDYSPHSPGMPPEAPGRTANWIGWQIVQKFMENQESAGMMDLLQQTDAQKLLDASGYRPIRK